jgi:hypothetical protein
MRVAAAALLALVIACLPASMAFGDEHKSRSSRAVRIAVNGYVQPQLAVRYRPDALPRDEVEFGMGNTRAGLIFKGRIYESWRFTVHFVIGGEFLEALIGLDAIDRDGDGAIDTVTSKAERVAGLAIEELSITWQPIHFFRLRAGQMRIPFTAAHRSANTALMFPGRSAPNDVFLRGSDPGFLAEIDLDGRFQVAAGLFNGSGVSFGRANERGPLLALRIDGNPIGAFPFVEGDLDRGPFRIGFGGGLIYYPSTIYDAAGFRSSLARDLRLSASVRLAGRGFFFQAELLRRQRTDSLSSRPDLATGAYGQLSYFVEIPDVFGFAPIARVGWTAQDQGFDPHHTIFIEGGLALYLGPDPGTAPRLVLQYVGELRLTEEEEAHGGLAELTVRF